MPVARRSTATGRRGHAPRSLALLGAALALLLIACTDSTDEPAATATPAGASSGVTTATPQATASPVPTEQNGDAAVAAWGRRVCAAASAFTVDFLESGDGQDPGELDLEARKLRAGAMFEVQYDAVRRATNVLEAIDPPARTADLHRLLLATYRDLNSALREQEEIIAEATSAEEIADSNLPVDELISLAFRQASLLADGGYCE